MILSGSHGSEDGITGLTDKTPENVDQGYTFYKQDCQLLGIKPGPPKRRLPLRDWSSVPDITLPAEKDVSFSPEPWLKDMDIRVCNVCYYHGNEDKLIQDIIMVKLIDIEEFIFSILLKFQPEVIMVAFCYSLNSDVSLMFRRHGIFSEMIITHDIRDVTGRSNATLSEQQKTILDKIGKILHK